MPKPGAERAAAAVAALPGAVYTPFDLTSRQAIPLHVGDTFLEPFEGARMESLREADYPGLHRYCDTRGLPALVDAIVQKLREKNALACERENVLVTAGATSGLGCAVSAIADPGEEVLILAPFWPLIRGAVTAQRATPVEVPFFDRVGSLGEALAAIERALTPRSVALYYSTPSNPSGRVLPAEWLAAFARLARERDLWLLSDEVYEDFVYRGEHVSTARFAPERTVSAFSFSKAYGIAGSRVGYLVGPRGVIDAAAKVSVHSAYHAPTAAQVSALRALEGGAAWIANARALYQQAGDAAAAVLGLSAPEGSCFLFVNVAERLDERGLVGFLEDCLEAGVVLAPGSSAGSDYGSWVRLCFTVVPPAQAVEAARRLAKRLGRA